MSIFDNNIENEDDIIRIGYDYIYDTHLSAHVLRTKKQDDDWWSYDMKTFVPLHVVWNFYLGENSPFIIQWDKVQQTFGIETKPKEKDFCEFAIKFNGVEKLTYKNVTFFNKAILWPLFDAFNELVVEKHMRETFNEQTINEYF